MADAERSDATVLLALGITLFFAGLALLLFGASEHVIPPTMGHLTNILLLFGLGFALLITGFMYTVVARCGEVPEIGPQGLSVARDPLTGSREWIALESVVRATLRPWSLSPWTSTRKYFEIDMALKAAETTRERRFYLHLPGDGEAFAKQLQESLGDRLSLAP